MISRRALRFLAVTFLLLSLPALCLAAKVKVDVNTERADAIYKVDEPVTFLVTGTADGKPIERGQVKVEVVLVRNGIHPRELGTIELGPEPVEIAAGSMGKPGFLQCNVTYKPEAKAGKKGKPITAMAAAAVSPEAIEPSMPVPDYFDAFWAVQKKKLAAMPMEPKLTPVETRNKNVEVFDVQINCPGGAPVSGYFGRPKGAGPKSLPAILWLQGAGVHSGGLRQPSQADKYGMLSMNINAHGIPNGKPAEYYRHRNATDLSDYRHRGDEDRETLYFKGMFLRLMRALDFLASQTEWDGKTLIVVGHSQGGAQAITAAGLDPRVTFLAAGVPAMCDHTGMVADRVAGWPKLVQRNVPNGKPNPKVLTTSRYYGRGQFRDSLSR